jgi:quercetin dioxygenase-like cupin family protein
MIALLLATVLQVGAAEPPAMPAWEEPRHRLVFEKDDIRIFNTNIPAGDRSLYHRHEHPTLYVVLNVGRMRNQDLGKDWVEIPPGPGMPAGAFLFRDYAAEPQVHRVENVGEQSFQVIGAVNLGPGTEAAAADSGTAEVHNRWFDGYRFKLPAGEDSEPHRHAHPVLVVQVSAGRSCLVEQGRLAAEKTVSGAWSMHDGGAEHALRNLGDATVDLVEIEIK